MTALSNTPRITAWWAPHIHAVRCGAGDIVLLDTHHDAYLHIPDPHAALHLVDRSGVEAPLAYVEPLAAAGLLSSAPFEGRRSPPTLPRRSIAGRLNSDAFGDAARPVRILRETGDVALADCLGQRAARRPPTRPTRPPDGAVGIFVRALPFIERQGACLWRCAVLDRLIHDTSGEVDWVFGVRLWPFSAHCWLQLGDAVLDDDPDRVALYAPILTL